MDAKEEYTRWTEDLKQQVFLHRGEIYDAVFGETLSKEEEEGLTILRPETEGDVEAMMADLKELGIVN